MRTNRFDFLEYDEQAKQPPSPPAEADPEAPIRFDAPSPKVPDIDRAPEPLAQALWQTPSQYAPAQDDPPRVARELRVVEVFGTRGTKAGEFNCPAGLALDRSGVLFVADTYNHRLQRITPDGGVAIVGSRGSGRGQFLTPMAVACDEDRSFYVIEQGNHRVQKFSVDGVFEMAFGRPGSREGEFRHPVGIAVAPGTREIYVSDTGNSRVQRFDKNGKFRGFLGAPGSIHPPLRSPQGITCDNGGNVYITDPPAQRIAHYDPAGRFVAHYGGMDDSLRQVALDIELNEPHALACDERRRLYIVDGEAKQGRLSVVWLGTGKVQTMLTNPGHKLGALARPSGLVIASAPLSREEPNAERGDLYVADTMNHRILRFVWSY